MTIRIRHIHARAILDSRGRPTVEVDVELENDLVARASVPSGASTGSHEAHELRDLEPAQYDGLGVSLAVNHVNGEIASLLQGQDVLDQMAIDSRLTELDGTAQLSRLGANAVLGVSLACCRAAALAQHQPLYARIAELSGTTDISMPMPMVNILSGGLHAQHGMDVQDFLAIPASAESIEHAIHMVSRVRNSAAQIMAQRGLPTLLADEGGLSPGFRTSRAALELIEAATHHAGLRFGADIKIAIDVAATTLREPASKGGVPVYRLAREGRDASSADMIDAIDSWIRDYPVISVEDGLDEDDWDGWKQLTVQAGMHCQLVGDDLFTTNPARVRRGTEQAIANGVLIKLNQNGTLSGTLDVVRLARAAGYATVISARSGETEDDFIADLAVGTAAGQIKIGSLRCGERMAKYNQLLRIEERSNAHFAGLNAFAGTR